MIFTILAGVVKVFLGYATKRNDNATATALETIRANLEVAREQAAITRAQLGHPVAWIPRFFAELLAVVYFGGVVLDSLFDLEGAVLALPTNEAALIGVIFAGMFIRTR